MTDYSRYPHITEDEFYAKCSQHHYRGDYYKELDDQIVFCNSAGCELASWEKGTGVYREL